MSDHDIPVITETEPKQNPVSETKPEPQTPSRDSIRAAVLGAKAIVKEVKPFFGTAVELRQPELGVVLDMRKTEEQHQIARMLIDYTFVPGTTEKVFDEADADGILQIPFGPDMKKYIDIMNELLGVAGADVEAAIKDATKST